MFKMNTQVRAEIERVERIGPPRKELLPKVLDKVLEDIRPLVAEMAEEGPDWVAYSLAASELERTFISTSPLDIRSAIRTICNTARASVTDGTVTYYNETGAASSPEHFKARYGHYPNLYKSIGTTVVVTGVQDRVGRAGGIYGWSKDRNMVAGALASYTHNFIQSIIAFFKRPRLPLVSPWVLPNLTLAETVAPEQFHPPASFTYSHIRPSFINTYTVVTSCDTPSRLGLEWWKYDKSDMARVEVELPEGTVKSTTRLIGPPLVKRTGYFTINVIDAPKGITVNSVSTSPITI